MTGIVGQQALLYIVSHLVFISITWWALQAIHIEKIIKKNHIAQTRMFLLLVTVAIGYNVSNFFLDYLHYARSLTYLFQ
ncbi:DUF1146 family protein [Priestia taiwanensis]|uniref:DUF1146 domain-containing protein n=1 Tax=Priestia taiwanensis TaxID=1347902 RepID=A0A917AZE7_9BACI|nr:DUF1146 family protein [Priestia taiwanensis]MBM7364345.1 putative integral membrane protein (TIGR02327 family) [Priestia taiwanensis]GGE85229.1 hypothetical protein GCM10007140_38380 [Priestia taiwanensis]